MPKKVPSAAKKTVAQVEVSQAVAAVKEVKPKTVVDTIASLQLSLPAEVAKIGNEVINLVNTRDNLTVAISESENRLREIHGIEAAAVTKDELLAEIEAQRAAWEDEKDRVDAERKREDSDYIVNLNRKYARMEQELSDKIDAAKRSEKLRSETLATDWASRESALKAKEDYLKDLEKQVAAHPTVVDNEVKKQVAIVANTMNKDHTNELMLRDKDKAHAESLSNATITSLNATITNLRAENEKLRVSLESAQRQVAEVAHKAVESASGRTALDALQASIASQNAGTNRK